MATLYVRDINSKTVPPGSIIQIRLYEVIPTRRYASGAVRLSGNGKDKFGQTIRIAVWDERICKMFEKFFVVNNILQLQDFLIARIDPTYNSTDCAFELGLNDASEVKLIIDEESDIPQLPPITYSNKIEMMRKPFGSTVHTVGILLEKGDLITAGKITRKLQVQDNKNKIMDITLWDHTATTFNWPLDDYIVIQNLKTTQFGGMSLNSINSTRFLTVYEAKIELKKMFPDYNETTAATNEEPDPKKSRTE